MLLKMDKYQKGMKLKKKKEKKGGGIEPSWFLPVSFTSLI